ncbi:MAG: methylated-DNA--[protein]-cysteine S-methyltransferase [Rhodobacteraceae bacterium]|jgi:methylated-DNA-[protein]-cysteine S-methyltransferase|nr:methylated-DNA--[protein]-cysteine S-methyltransferase [Paracoccaceae bacterium]
MSAATSASVAFWRHYDSPLGALRLVAQNDLLIGLYFPEHRPQPCSAGWQADPGTGALTQTCRELDEYFAGQRQAFTVPLQLFGTAFQQRVQRTLAKIPFGTTVSYGALAQQCGSDRGARPVGSANARNPIAIILPCHRVIAADGALGGYAGGLARKAWLLQHEQNWADRSARAPFQTIDPIRAGA